MSLRILTQTIRAELDVVASRQRARQIAALCGFGAQDQARIATAVSELARNVFSYVGSGRISFSIEGSTAPQLLVITIEDKGTGIAQLDLVLSGRYQSSTGMGLGLLGARRMMDQFEIDTGPGGTTIVLRKLLPSGSPVMTAALIGEVGGQLAGLAADVTLSEMQQQNKELLATLAELKTRQDELLELTRELEDTNRGVVALYAELDEKADHLRRADDMKSRFLSNMSHEFRTPLSSIRALSRLLIDRVDGELNGEQDKQARYILSSAEALTDLVDDLLDLAKIEAGKIDVRPVQFDVGEMFSALRGMLRPLLVSNTVDLVFDEPDAPISMYTDEAKLSQILRNFISNALKFTERGEVRVSARVIAGGTVEFAVKDTGLGIAPANQQLIFEEFSQVENALQSRVKGTGLGLPLCRKLALLLGGEVNVESTLGEGSTFRATVALQYSARPGTAPDAHELAGGVPDGIPILVVEDNPGVVLLYKTFFRDSPFRMVAARSIWEADQALRAVTPAAVVLDLYLTGEDTWRWLSDFKSDPACRHVPVIVASEVEDPGKAFALGASAYFKKPLRREDLIQRLSELCALAPDDKGRGAAPR
ncbi:ATP-binding protein [Massilia sp. CF038]|uniref:ATP-binding protein n=1 Tax=Massilia sp. CF038 TaxID=1881045 RepID=UPI00091B68D9|nr:ATP-binding protein [Massilia sp. CF038]SHG70927.1 Signal transduction histidine kinase [Massilia sp. CF038]